MKNIFKFLVVILVFVGCKKEDEKVESVENSTWIAQFEDFRTAVSQADLPKMKSFVDFPISGEAGGINEIWTLTGKENVNLETPFTAKDFDENYHTIFSKPFANCLTKIDSDVLYKTDSFESPSIKDGKTDYKIMANFDKKTNQLELHLYSETLIKEINEGEEFEEKAEFSIIYYFEILKNNQLKFRYIRTAG